MRELSTAWVAAVMVALALSAGCRGSERQKEEHSLRPVDGLAAVPARVDAMIVANVRALSRSALARRAIGEMLARDPELARRSRELLAECKLTPGEDVTGLVLAMGEEPDRSMLLAQGRFDEAALVACVGKSLSASGGELRRESDSGRTVLAAVGSHGQPPVYFALGSPTTLVVSSSREMLGQALGTGDKVAKNRRMSGLIARANQDAAVWAVGLVPEAVGKGLVGKAGIGGPPQAMVGFLDLESGLDTALSVEMADARDASAAVSLAKPQLAAASLVAQKEGLGRLVNRIQMNANGRWVVMSLAMKADEVGEILARVQRTVDRSQAPQQNPASGPPSTNPKAAPAHEE